MRYAIFSDIYGNRPAWEALVADLARHGVDMPICLGDISGHGPGTREILRALRALTGNIVLGDHDAAVAGLLDDTRFDAATRQALAWTRAHLDGESLGYLAHRPLAVETGGVLFVHGECVQPGRYGGVQDLPAAHANFAASHQRVTFLGHGAEAGMFRERQDGTVEELPAEDGVLSEDCRFLVKVGPVGEPASGAPVAASYVIYDNVTQEVYFRHAPYDAEAYRMELQAAGLPLPLWYTKVSGGGPPVVEPPGGSPPVAVFPGGGEALPAQVASSIIPAPPEPVRWIRGLVAWSALFGVLAMVSAIGVFVWYKMNEVPGEGGEEASRGETPEVPVPIAPSPPALELADKEMEPGPDVMPDTPDPAGAGEDPVTPAPSGAPEVAITNDPPAPPPDVAPQAASPEPVSRPEPLLPEGPAPMPPEPANASSLPPLTNGLLFYAPFDEESTEFRARDLSGGERDLDVTSGSPGEVGQVELACRLVKNNGSDALVSEARPLPELKALTMALWFRRPTISLEDVPDPGAPPPVPPIPDATLLALKGVCEVRVEGDRVVADLEIGGAAASLPLPRDLRWHHILVEHEEGRTSIWLDYHLQSEEVEEKLGTAPAGGGAVQVGSKDADFWIDEAAIWSRKFTADERCVLYRLGRRGSAIITPPRAVAHWGFDGKAASRLFPDDIGIHVLGALRSWKPVKAIAPDPVPLTSKGNTVAARIWKVGEREDGAGSFEMKGDNPFTYEGWFKPGRTSTGILGGTVSLANEEKAAGWLLALRPARSGKGILAFIYDTGSERLQAMAENLPFFDGLPHHVAAVWNPRFAETHGSMTLFMDNKMVASTQIPLDRVGAPGGQRFRISVEGSPMVVDELRFTTGSLKPVEFLTTGKGWTKPQAGPVAGNGENRNTPAARPGESPFQRAERELQERKAAQKAERERKRAEEERKRRGFGLGD